MRILKMRLKNVKNFYNMTQEKFNELIEHPARVNKDFIERFKKAMCE